MLTMEARSQCLPLCVVPSPPLLSRSCASGKQITILLVSELRHRLDPLAQGIGGDTAAKVRSVIEHGIQAPMTFLK